MSTCKRMMLCVTPPEKDDLIILSKLIKIAFNEFPNIKDTLIEIFSTEISTSRYIPLFILTNYNEIPENIRELIIQFSEDNNKSKLVAEALRDNFNIINSELVINVDTEYNYQLLDQNGSLLKHGAFLPGTNRVATNAIPGGFLLLRVFNNSGTQLFKLIKQ